jgi:hypothetical protein
LEVVDDNVTDETLRRLADLRAAVLESKAPDVVALRRLLRQLFKEITYADGKLFPNLRVHEAPCPVDERPLGWPREARSLRRSRPHPIFPHQRCIF